MNKYVYVVAYEHSPGGAGSGGFDWYFDWNKAVAAYDKIPIDDDNAKFLTSYQIEEDDTPKSITDAIDADLALVCANAATRVVGANVRRYWNENNFKMG